MVNQFLLKSRRADPRAELGSRLEQPPEEHAEPCGRIRSTQECTNRGVLEIMRGALAASDEILEK